jgi:hypothetical protein
MWRSRTRVPGKDPKFFDDEFAAHAKTARLIDELLGCVIPTADDIGSPGPPEWVRPGDLASWVAMERIVAFARKHRPDLFRLMVQTVEASQRPTETGAAFAADRPPTYAT